MPPIQWQQPLADRGMPSNMGGNRIKVSFLPSLALDPSNRLHIRCTALQLLPSTRHPGCLHAVAFLPPKKTLCRAAAGTALTAPLLPLLTPPSRKTPRAALLPQRKTLARDNLENKLAAGVAKQRVNSKHRLHRRGYSTTASSLTTPSPHLAAGFYCYSMYCSTAFGMAA